MLASGSVAWIPVVVSSLFFYDFTLQAPFFRYVLGERLYFLYLCLSLFLHPPNEDKGNLTLR
jgi:hypothetical protein